MPSTASTTMNASRNFAGTDMVLKNASIDAPFRPAVRTGAILDAPVRYATL